jgi:SAM-dependent methyltransferase
MLERLNRYCERLRLAPFRATLLFNPFYILPKLRSIASWDDLVRRLKAFKSYLQRSERHDPALIAEVTARSSREDVLLRWARGKGIDIGSGEKSAFSGRAETLDFDPRWRGNVDVFAPCDRIPVADGHYDFILASHILEHLPNPVAALAEWSRVLRHDGTLILFLPDCRLYVPDRIRLDATVPVVSPQVLTRAFRRGESNGDDTSLAGFSKATPTARFNAEHRYLWRLDVLCRLLESLGFELLYAEEATEAFSREFETRLLPRYARRFVDILDAEDFTADIRILQYRCGESILDYSFIVVAKNPERSKILSALATLNAGPV